MSNIQKFLDKGVLHRFDSANDILYECYDRWPEADIRTYNENGNLILYVRMLDALVGEASFKSLIVHFEGEKCYAVMLPSSNNSCKEYDAFKCFCGRDMGHSTCENPCTHPWHACVRCLWEILLNDYRKSFRSEAAAELQHRKLLPETTYEY